MPAVTFRLVAGSPMPDRSKESSQNKRTPSPVLTPPPSPIPFPPYLPSHPTPLPPAQGALTGEARFSPNYPTYPYTYPLLWSFGIVLRGPPGPFLVPMLLGSPRARNHSFFFPSLSNCCRPEAQNQAVGWHDTSANHERMSHKSNIPRAGPSEGGESRSLVGETGGCPTEYGGGNEAFEDVGKRSELRTGQPEQSGKTDGPFGRRSSIGSSPKRQETGSDSAGAVEGGDTYSSAPEEESGARQTERNVGGGLASIQSTDPEVNVETDVTSGGGGSQSSTPNEWCERLVLAPPPSPAAYAKRKRPEVTTGEGSPSHKPSKRRETPEVYVLRETMGSICRLVEELNGQVDKCTKREIKSLAANLKKHTQTLKTEQIKKFLNKHQYEGEVDILQNTKLEAQNSLDADTINTLTTENDRLRREVIKQKLRIETLELEINTKRYRKESNAEEDVFRFSEAVSMKVFEKVAKRQWHQDNFKNTEVIVGNPLNSKTKDVKVVIKEPDGSEMERSIQKIYKDTYPEISTITEEFDILEQHTRTRSGNIINIKRLIITTYDGTWVSAWHMLEKIRSEVEEPAVVTMHHLEKDRIG
ncbi:hypothetical protein ABEB36_015695 [Hypothenemus hampei]|uniref:Uncharacterized protein n=1 Tax=Hypothenemus hampei TaxID=57062 RepID=A0ABD1DZX7_HYPHA